MFEKREYRIIRGVNVKDVWAQSLDWWQRAGFAIGQRGPSYFGGESFHSKIGLRREVDVRLSEAQGNLHVDVSFRARITDEGMVGGAVAAVVFLPVAAVGGAISWSEYEDEANRLISGFWDFLSHVTGKPTEYVPAAPQPVPSVAPAPGASGAAKFCTKCGAGLDAKWKLCPHCGQPVA